MADKIEFFENRSNYCLPDVSTDKSSEWHIKLKAAGICGLKDFSCVMCQVVHQTFIAW